MSIQEVTSKDNRGLTNKEGHTLRKAWELDVLGNILLLERYGSFCGWTELKLKRQGVEVYRIVKPWGDEEREEFFFNRLARTYVGDQFSFVEYIAQITEHKRFPLAEEYVQAGLDADVERLYRDNLQRILNP